ncbi:WD40 repeat-like protein [Cryptosporidium felis]|nr:WD40 repeat-like protein [Cryptosporidium felis]
MKNDDYVTEVSYHSSGAFLMIIFLLLMLFPGDRLVLADIKCNLHVLDLLRVNQHTENETKLVWVRTFTLQDSSINGVISRITWSPECYGQMFVAGTTEKSIYIWSETRMSYQDSYHLLRSYGDENGLNETSFGLEPKNPSFNSWKLITSFSPFKGKITNIKFANKNHGIKFAACDSNGIVGVFTCNDVNMKVGWELETIKVRKADQFSDLNSSISEKESSCSLDWIPDLVNLGLGITVAINNTIYILQKKSRFWNCIETITVNNSGIIKDISCSGTSLFEGYYKLATLHEGNTLITWKYSNRTKTTSIGNQNNIISPLHKFEIIDKVERIHWHPLGHILIGIRYNGQTNYWIYIEKENLREITRDTLKRFFLDVKN